MSWNDLADGSDSPGRGASCRARRLLVRILQALRREARGGSDERRVQELADRIMLVLPRRLLPIGAISCAVLALACLMPLLRDALPATGVVEAPRPAVAVVESGLRAHGAAINEGLGALRAAVAPFADSEDEPVADEAATPQAPGSVVAAAPFKKS